MADAFPLADLPFLDFVSNFSARISLTPTAYGTTALIAADLAALVSDFSSRMTTLENPATKNKITIAQKQVSKKSCVAKTRVVIKQVYAFPTISVAQLEELRLPQRDTTRSPRPVPGTKPLLMLAPDGSYRVADEATPDKRTKPFGAQGAVISVKIADAGAPAPLSPADAHVGVLATRDRGQIAIPPGSNGRVLYAVAQWYTERGDLGPAGDVVSTVIAA